MKTNYLILFLLLICFILPDVNANTFHKKGKKPILHFQKALIESESQTGCFDENTHIFNLGIGFGGGEYYKGATGSAYTYARSPAISLTYEQAWKPKLGPGYLGIGAYLGYEHARYRYDYYYNNYYNNGIYYNGTDYYYEHNWNHIMIAARAAYHWDVLNSDKAEVYAGTTIGMRIQTYSYSSNDPSPNRNNNRLNENSVYPAASLFIGARWYFVPKVALFGEAGYGISYLTGGISFKF